MPVSLAPGTTSVSTSDGYTDPCTLGPLQYLQSVQFTVQTNPVLCQIYRTDRLGILHLDPFEIPLQPGQWGFDQVQGIRFRSASAGKPAKITCTGFLVDDAVPFGSQTGASPLITSGIPVYLDGVLTAQEAGLDFEDSATVTWSIVDDPVHGVASISAQAAGGITAVDFYHNEGFVAAEPGADFKDTTSVLWTLTDDAVDGFVKAQATALAVIYKDGVSVGAEQRLNFDDASTNVKWTITDEPGNNRVTVKGNVGRQYVVEMRILTQSQPLAVQSGLAFFIVPQEFNGLSLTACAAAITTVSSANKPDFALRNVTQSNVAILSTDITIDVGAFTSYTAAVQPVINGAHAGVSTGDEIAVDIVAAGTGAVGLYIILTFG